MQTVKAGAYAISISDDLRQLAKKISGNKFSEIILLVDENTRAHCLPLLLDAAPQLQNAWVFEIPAGEGCKTIDTCSVLWKELLEKNIDRNALFINLGGGVIGDMGGFVASCFKRGITFINIPTTLLAMVDATIGGKLGVDFGNVKNAVGLFANPGAVLIYPGFLETLSFSELTSGFAEMLKHTLIHSGKEWEEIKRLNPAKVKKWDTLIYRSLLVKKKIVQIDPYEKNARKALNFGHTFGHAFESAALAQGTPLLHGHAVAMGMIAESYLSHKLAGLPEKQLTDITNTIVKLYGGYFPKRGTANWKRWITHDKKNVGGKYNFTLLTSIGKFTLDVHCEERLLQASVNYLNSRL